MSVCRGGGVAARLCGPLTGLQSLMMDEHCPLASLTSDRRQTTADACSDPPPPPNSPTPFSITSTPALRGGCWNEAITAPKGTTTAGREEARVRAGVGVGGGSSLVQLFNVLIIALPE